MLQETKPPSVKQRVTNPARAKLWSMKELLHYTAEPLDPQNAVAGQVLMHHLLLENETAFPVLSPDGLTGAENLENEKWRSNIQRRKREKERTQTARYQECRKLISRAEVIVLLKITRGNTAP